MNGILYFDRTMERRISYTSIQSYDILRIFAWIDSVDSMTAINFDSRSPIS